MALPPGLIGNVNGIPKCTAGELNSEHMPRTASRSGKCKCGPPSETSEEQSPLYNIVPPSGLRGRVRVPHPKHRSAASSIFRVRTGGDYGVTAESLNISAKSRDRGRHDRSVEARYGAVDAPDVVLRPADPRA